MFIKDNRKAKTVTFAIFKIGEVFFDVNDTEAFCMKINPIFTLDGDVVNAINLENGNTYTFDGDEEVEMVSASMSIN